MHLLEHWKRTIIFLSICISVRLKRHLYPLPFKKGDLFERSFVHIVLDNKDKTRVVADVLKIHSCSNAFASSIAQNFADIHRKLRRFHMSELFSNAT